MSGKRISEEPDTSTLAGRVLWILRDRKISANELSRRAGLSQAHVSLILSRARTNRGSAASLRTVRAIASGGCVDFEWLAMGAGTPSTPQTDPALVCLDAERSRWPADSDTARALARVRDAILARRSP